MLKWFYQLFQFQRPICVQSATLINQLNPKYINLYADRKLEFFFGSVNVLLTNQYAIEQIKPEIQLFFVRDFAGLKLVDVYKIVLVLPSM